MSTQKFNNPEEWAGEVFGQTITKGNLTLYRNFRQLFIKIMATNVLVLIRHRFGTRFVNYSSISWGAFLLFLLYLASMVGRGDYTMTTGQQPTSPGSAGLYWNHMMLVIFVSIYHWWESWQNLKKGKERRHSYDHGQSLLWKPFAWLLIQVSQRLNIPLSFHPFLFQKWVEPVLVILAGMLFRSTGYTGYGMMLIFSGVCIHMTVRFQERAYFEAKQNGWDGHETSEVLAEQTQGNMPGAGHGHVVTTKQLKNDSGFEHWKAQKAQQPSANTEPPVEEEQG